MSDKTRIQNINNLRTEKKGINLLLLSDNGFYIPDKDQKRKLYDLAGIDFKIYQRSVDCVKLSVPDFKDIKSTQDFQFIEVKSTKDEKVKKLPFNVFFGFTKNEEELFKSLDNYRLCIVHTTLNKFHILNYEEYLNMIKTKRVQFQINFRGEM